MLSHRMRTMISAAFPGLVLAAVTLAAPSGVAAQSAGCAGAAFHALDFWIGDWTVTTAAGSEAGTSHVAAAAGGCALVEEYATRGGPYRGVGLHVYDPTASRWRQLWSDNRPTVVEMGGEPVPDGLRYTWSATLRDGRTVPRRYTLTRLPDGGVRQLGERSDDEGVTWVAEFDYRYRRR